MPIKAVIFDLDGVICSTDEYHYQAWKALAEELGLHFDRDKNNRLRGISRMASLDIVLEDSPVKYDDAHKLQLSEKKNAEYKRLLSQLGPEAVFPGVRETLNELRNAGVKTAIGSSSKNTKLILERLGLTDIFDAVADGTDITRSKPDPEVFLCAANKLGIAPEYCAVVEDASAGIQAAKSAGMLAIAYGGDACSAPNADVVIKAHAELISLI